MKTSIIIFALLCTILNAQEISESISQELIKNHQSNSNKVAEEQDELSADVQQLVIEQTHPKVIELLSDVENIMDEATDRLMDYDTSADTISAQTEIIEKIYSAAKEKQKNGSGKSGGAMMDMMERMMGKEPSPKPGGASQPGQTGGGGQSGSSDSSNTQTPATANGKAIQRTVPKSSGTNNTNTPEEFHRALDAYNRGVEKKLK